MCRLILSHRALRTLLRAGSLEPQPGACDSCRKAPLSGPLSWHPRDTARVLCTRHKGAVILREKSIPPSLKWSPTRSTPPPHTTTTKQHQPLEQTFISTRLKTVWPTWYNPVYRVVGGCSASDFQTLLSVMFGLASKGFKGNVFLLRFDCGVLKINQTFAFRPHK